MPNALSCTDANSSAMLWLLKAGTSPEEADHNGIRWHEPTERLIMPIRNEQQELTGVLARAVNGERPKYKLLSGTYDIHFPKPQLQTLVVVVEDILSSIAATRAGFDSIALLGTSLTPEQAARIANNRQTVVGFFDPDKAGKQALVRLRKALGLYPVSVYNAHEKCDPKYLNRQQLRNAIHEALRRKHA